MLSELAIPHIRCCLSAIPSDLMKSTVVDESLSSMNLQFCSRENQLLQLLQQNEKPTSKRLLELISSYSFNLYYIKGKATVLSDFLLRQKNDDSNPHEIIPISFNMYKILNDNYYNIEKYLIQT